MGCRGRFAQGVLVRFVRSAQGWCGDDTSRRANGRGAYLCSRACAIKVEKNKRFVGLSAVAREHDALCDARGNVYDIGVP